MILRPIAEMTDEELEYEIASLREGRRRATVATRKRPHTAPRDPAADLLEGLSDEERQKLVALIRKDEE